MKVFLFIAIAFLFVSGISHARIGETIEQCVERYGKPTLGETNEKWKSFERNGIRISIDFSDRIAVQVHYSSKKLLGKLTDEQVQELLKIYADGKKWETLDIGLDGISKKEYKRADGAIFATWEYAHGSISFITS